MKRRRILVALLALLLMPVTLVHVLARRWRAAGKPVEPTPPLAVAPPPARSRPRRRRALLAAAALFVLAGGTAGGYVLYVERQSADVRGSPTVEFLPTEQAAAPPPLPPPPPSPRPGRRVPGEAQFVYWPTYGYDARRLRVLPGSSLRPPFRRIWTFRAGSLIEFPPAVAYGRLYFASNSGRLFAVYARSGKLAWRFDSGRCVASSPAVADRTVYETFLNRPPCNAGRSDVDGELVAFDTGNGQVRWRKAIGPTESSPLVADGLVYAGDWDGKVWALDAATGRAVWTFQAGGKVKGAVALAYGRLYVGAYDGRLYALDPRTGRLLWRASSQGGLGGLGTFYSTPAVAYDRVYIGSTDGKVYSFGAGSGELRWSRSTGGYVYGSPAVWRREVLIGSYSGRFYALDAATGERRWEFSANGPISGSATVIDGIVYFSTLRERTYALNAATGKELWSFPDGKYTPVVADPRRLYLVGYARVYGLVRR